jgi:hypothetical protein
MLILGGTYVKNNDGHLRFSIRYEKQIKILHVFGPKLIIKKKEPIF